MCGPDASGAPRPEDLEGWRTFEDVETVPTIDELIASMRQSRYLDPVTVDLEISDQDMGTVLLKTVITGVQVVYVGSNVLKNQSPVGCYPYPDYHFDGWLLKSGYDPYSGIIRVHGEIMVKGDSPEIATVTLRFSPPGPLTRFQRAVGIRRIATLARPERWARVAFLVYNRA